MASQKRILFVFTSAAETSTGKSAGWYLPEAAHPYHILSKHFEIDFAAPKGPNPPISPISVQLFKDEESLEFLNDPTIQQKLATAKPLSDVKASDYVAVFYPGGHGPVIDLAVDKVNIALANEFWQSGKIVAAVCHGPAAIVGVTDKDGVPIFKGKEVTGFSNEEEGIADYIKDLPFLLEDRLKELGGVYVKADKNFDPFVRVQGKLVTGQNPASSKGVGEEIRKLVEAA